MKFYFKFSQIDFKNMMIKLFADTLCPSEWHHYGDVCLKIGSTKVNFSQVECEVGTFFKDTMFGYWTMVSLSANVNLLPLVIRQCLSFRMLLVWMGMRFGERRSMENAILAKTPRSNVENFCLHVQ